MDVSVVDGIEMLREYMFDFEPKTSLVWTRGTLDSICIEDLCKHFGVKEPFHWSRVRDIRTYIDVLAETSKMNGYCETVKKMPYSTGHDPVHDVARDCFMMRYFK